MDRDEVIAGLRNLRQELERDKILEDISLALLLSDACMAIGLSESEQAEVMGRKATRQVERWKKQVWRPVETETGMRITSSGSWKRVPVE